jgi:Na+/H+ antiporter NhaD/arsenite permease-like protein
MTTLTISIIVVFVLGYALIATESLTKVNKAAIALLMLVGCWTLYMMDPMQYLQLMHPDYTGGAAGMVEKVTGIIQEHLGDTATTLFFLMGAMTIVEIVDQNGGFNWVRKVMKTKSKRALLWRIAILTFFLSAILDNLTTSIVMIMILRKLVTDHKDRMVYASLVIIAANSGGAFSPIGDVTTIMLWNKGLITAAGVIAEIFIPSVVSMVIPALILQTMLKGELVMPEVSAQQNASVSDFTEGQRKAVFWLGVGGLIFVPIFKSITHLPPFVGILLVLGVLWTATEVFYRGLHRGDWKVVTVKKDAPLELYNIKEDMTESVNLANKYPEKVAQFEKEMKAMRIPTPNWPLSGE